jgi:hypothetical protein
MLASVMRHGRDKLVLQTPKKLISALLMVVTCVVSFTITTPQVSGFTGSKFDLSDSMKNQDDCVGDVSQKERWSDSLESFILSFELNAKDFMTQPDKVLTFGNGQDQIEIGVINQKIHLLIPFRHSSSLRFPIFLSNIDAKQNKITVQVVGGRKLIVTNNMRVIYVHNYIISSFYTNKQAPLKCYFSSAGTSLISEASYKTLQDSRYTTSLGAFFLILLIFFFLLGRAMQLFFSSGQVNKGRRSS